MKSQMPHVEDPVRSKPENGPGCQEHKGKSSDNPFLSNFIEWAVGPLLALVKFFGVLIVMCLLVALLMAVDSKHEGTVDCSRFENYTPPPSILNPDPPPECRR